VYKREKLSERTDYNKYMVDVTLCIV
jgi:hypothetical protein